MEIYDRKHSPFFNPKYSLHRVDSQSCLGGTPSDRRELGVRAASSWLFACFVTCRCRHILWRCGFYGHTTQAPQICYGLTHNLQRHRIGYGHPLLAVDVAGGPALVVSLVLVGDVVHDQSGL